MITNRNREDFLRFLLFDYEPVQMSFDVARQQVEFEFLGFRRLFILFGCRLLWLGNCRNGNMVAEVLFHEVRDLGLQLFRRRELRWGWGWVFCHVRQTSSQRRFVATLGLESDRDAWRLFGAFSYAEKIQRRANAMTVAVRRECRVLVAPHQGLPEARRTMKNAPSGQVRSFAAKRAPSGQIPSAP